MKTRILFLFTILFGLFPFVRVDAAALCAQVIQYAENNDTGECQAYPTPCDVPSGWTAVRECSIKTPSKNFSPKFEVQKFASCEAMEDKMIDILKRYQSRYWYPMYTR